MAMQQVRRLARAQAEVTAAIHEVGNPDTAEALHEAAEALRMAANVMAHHGTA